MTDALKLEIMLETIHTIDTKRKRRGCVRSIGGEGMEKGHTQYEVYRIVVKGHLDHTWSDWFDGLTIRQTDTGETILSGPLADQSALHGVLIKVRDLGLPLLSLALIEPAKADN